MKAILALEDGTLFEGTSFGADGESLGEVVYNTSITGYQEILTDPSYNQQMVTLTYPHIGNYGVCDEDSESSHVHAAGLIIKNLPLMHSNFRAQSNLSDYLKAHKTVAISSIDTRKLTRHLREHVRTITGKEQLVINGFAKALETIPRQLAENSGMDSTDILNKLRQLHTKAPADNIWQGVNVL